MTPRKKTGIGFLIGAVISTAMGIIKLSVDQDPAWLPVVTHSITTLASIAGFLVVYPDK